MAATTEKKKARKQERTRLRRQLQRRDAKLSELYKPIEEWDDEELAKGRPRNLAGDFRGAAPKWVSAQVHEEAVRRFKDISAGEVRGLVPLALDTLRLILEDKELDDRGRYRVPVSTQAEVSKWCVEHLLGKPTQRVEADISVRLKSVLAMAVTNPDGQLSIEAESWEAEDMEQEPGES